MKKKDDGAWTRFKTLSESMESKKGDNIVISVGLLLIIIVAVSLSGCAHSAEDPVRYDVSSATVDKVFICRLLKEETPLSFKVDF